MTTFPSTPVDCHLMVTLLLLLRISPPLGYKTFMEVPATRALATTSKKKATENIGKTTGVGFMVLILNT